MSLSWALGEEGKSGTRVWCTFQSFESKHAQSGLNSVWSGHSSNLNLFIGLIANLELRLRSPNTVLRASRFESVKTCQSALCNVFARRSCKQNESNYPSPFSDGVSRTALAYLGKSYLFQKKLFFQEKSLENPCLSFTNSSLFNNAAPVKVEPFAIENFAIAMVH